MKLIRPTHQYPLFFHKIPKAYHNTNTPLKKKNQNKMQTKTTKNQPNKTKIPKKPKTQSTTPPKQTNTG